MKPWIFVHPNLTPPPHLYQALDHIQPSRDDERYFDFRLMVALKKRLKSSYEAMNDISTNLGNVMTDKVC